MDGPVGGQGRCATSDAPPVLRRRAAYTGHDSRGALSRPGQVGVVHDGQRGTKFFALAAREIGLSAGEPPSTRGYPPSVFAELPRLLERAGPGEDKSRPWEGQGTRPASSPHSCSRCWWRVTIPTNRLPTRCVALLEPVTFCWIAASPGGRYPRAPPSMCSDRCPARPGVA